MTEDTVQPALERPRFRNDLVAQPLEEEGVRYVDVTDPNSGSTFRFYDVEYSIACAMDGERNLDNLAEWTRAELGIEASNDELQSVVNTLAELGYLENVEAQPAAEAPFAEGAEAVPQAVDNLPTEVVEEPSPGAEAEAGAAITPVALPQTGYTDETAREVSEAHDQVMEITAEPSGIVMEPPEAPAETGPREEAAPHPVGPIMDEAGTGSAADERPETHVDEAAPASQTAPATPPPPPKPVETEMSFAGLLEDEERAAAAEEVKPIQRSARSSPPVHALDDEDPTQVPTTGVEDDDDDVSVDLSAHLALDKREVEEAVRSSRVHAVPTLPPGVSLDDEESETGRVSVPTEAPAARSGPPPIPPPSPADAEARAAGDRPQTRPPEDLRVPPAVPLPNRPGAPLMGVQAQTPPSGAAASQSGVRPRPARPIEPTRVPPPAKTPPRSGSSIGLIIVLLVAGLALVAAYVFRDRIFGSDDYTGRTPPAPRGPDRAPTASSPQPAATTPPTATTPEPAALKESLPTATVRADAAGAGDKVTAKSPSGGNVAWVVDNGAKVEAGAPVVKLFGHAKIEGKLAEGIDRGKFYQGKLDEAKTKGDPVAIDQAQKKVDEKKAMVEAAQKELEKYVVTAPAAGPVKLTVTKGSQVKPGDVVAEIGGAKPEPVLRATFDAGANAAKYKDGGNAVVAAKGAPDKQLAAVVEKVDGSQVSVKLVAAGGATAAAGDEIVLLPPSEK